MKMLIKRKVTFVFFFFLKDDELVYYQPLFGRRFIISCFIFLSASKWPFPHTKDKRLNPSAGHQQNPMIALKRMGGGGGHRARSSGFYYPFRSAAAVLRSVRQCTAEWPWHPPCPPKENVCVCVLFQSPQSISWCCLPSSELVPLLIFVL